jgi:hypothetical protein
MSMRRGVLFAAAVASTVVAFSAPALAASAGPGWELFANSYPTNFGGGADEVQEVTASEESGTFTLTFEGVTTSPINDHATDGEVQAALEGLSSIGGADVSVTGATPGKFLVMFVNTLGNMKVTELSAAGATVSVATEGLASGTIGVDVFNIGAVESEGAVTVTDTLPRGIKAKEAGALVSPGFFGIFGLAPLLEPGVWDCTGNGLGPSPHVAGASVVTCTNDATKLEHIAGGGGTLTFGPNETGNLEPAIGIAVEAEQGAAEGTKSGAEGNHVSIAGGGAPEPASTVSPVTISSQPAKGGLAAADAWFSNADGTVDRQAGSHPYTATFVFGLATAVNARHEPYFPRGEVRNLETTVPPGLIGDLHSTAQCTRAQLFSQSCPPASMIGRLTIQLLEAVAVEQVYNMVPSPGVPAELGFNYAEVPVFIGFAVRTGGDYAVVSHVNDIPQKGSFQSILTLWGVPGDKTHDIWRHGNNGCGHGSLAGEMEGPPFVSEGIPNYCRVVAGAVLKPLLRLPTSCAGPEPFDFRELNGWEESAATSEVAFSSHDANDNPVGLTGCGALALEPSFLASPESASTDSPTGLSVEVKPPLGAFEDPEGLAPADIRTSTVVLPEGLVVNPGQASGLQACPNGRPSPGHYGDALTTAEEASQRSEDTEASSCPPASKVGTATVKSRLLEGDPQKQFEGGVYLLPSNPPEVKLLVAASADGVNLKLVGAASLCQAVGEVLDGKTCGSVGQVVASFKDTPQLPFTDFTLKFEGGSKAALTTPTQCGTYTANADFTPWSSPFESDFLTNASFAITEGPNGGACPSGPLPFAPALTAGTTSTEAGAFTDFSMRLQRGDGQQRIERLQFKSPAGLSAMTASVPLCDEADADAGTCPAASHVGHAIVASGAGNSPLVLPQPGGPELPIYLTGPYKGAPFGLSIVTPVLAGPFNLGTIVTRATIEVDPVTAQITVTTDQLPQIVKGVPTDIRSIDAIVDRPGFFFNPTNCTPQQFSGTATAVGGATAHLSSPFAVGACQALKFTPQLTASTTAKTSKASGAGLDVKITYPAGAQADISKVDLTIPAILPTRLTTIQQACTEATFNANPASCPAGSVIASAIVHTPVLKSPLTGPVYFVSHGNAAFPDVEMLLQGEGVTLVVDGKTQIKKGVTFSHFETVPDEPFSSFEFSAPEGPHSIFAANGDLCASEIKLPTTLTGQNGAVLTQSTPVVVEGCANRLRVVSRKVKKRTLTLRVIVPAAGTLTARGKDVTKASKSAKGRSTLTLTVKSTKAHGRVKAKVRLRFTQSNGHILTSTVAAHFPQ